MQKTLVVHGKHLWMNLIYIMYSAFYIMYNYCIYIDISYQIKSVMIYTQKETILLIFISDYR